MVNRESVFGTVEAVKTVSDLFMPLDGEVLEVNAKLEGNPELVNSDAYGEGWMVKIKITNPAQVADLLAADAYQSVIG